MSDTTGKKPTAHDGGPSTGAAETSGTTSRPLTHPATDDSTKLTDTSTAADGSDEVDRIVEAWQRELPGLDTSPLHVMSRLSRLNRHLDLARRSAFAANDLEPWEFDVLAALRRKGAPYEDSPSALVAETLSTSGTMTNRLTRLEARGYVTRHRAETDRRSSIVRLTDAGKQAAEATLTTLLDHERDLLAGMDANDQQQLTRLLRRMLLSFD